MITHLFPYDHYKFNSEFIFKSLPDDVLDILLRNQEIRKYKQGETIFKENSRPMGIHKVESGLVKKSALGHEGKEHIFYFCTSGEFLGHRALLSEEVNHDTSIAVLDSEVSFIPKADFLLALKVSHLLCERIIKSLSHEFGVFIHRTQILSQHPVRERTAIALLILLEKFKQVTPKQPIIELTRNDLANFIGTAQETTVRILHEFKDEGIIDIQRRKIFVLDPGELKNISNYF